jgi:hypothetical protein
MHGVDGKDIRKLGISLSVLSVEFQIFGQCAFLTESDEDLVER